MDVEENADRASGESVLGKDPKTGKQVAVRLGRFGPMVQIGTVEEEEKPLFASLLPEQSLIRLPMKKQWSYFNYPEN